MKVKELEARLGMSRASIRFYEKEGLLHPSRRTNGYREYTEEDALTLEKIALLRRLEMPVEMIRQVQVEVYLPRQDTENDDTEYDPASISDIAKKSAEGRYFMSECKQTLVEILNALEGKRSEDEDVNLWMSNREVDPYGYAQPLKVTFEAWEVSIEELSDEDSGGYGPYLLRVRRTSE